MDLFLVVVAQYAVFLVPVGALAAWWPTPGRVKVRLVLALLTAGVLMAVAIKGFGMLWTDPRPFVVDGTPPLFPHSADNGFPSDHTSFAATVAAVVLAYRRWWGVGLLTITVAVGAARVAAHLHHIPDIAGGLLIGLAAAGAGVVTAQILAGQWEGRRRPARPGELTPQG